MLRHIEGSLQPSDRHAEKETPCIGDRTLRGSVFRETGIVLPKCFGIEDEADVDPRVDLVTGHITRDPRQILHWDSMLILGKGRKMRSKIAHHQKKGAPCGTAMKNEAKKHKATKQAQTSTGRSTWEGKLHPKWMRCREKNTDTYEESDVSQ